jgi:hypothetical protein
MKLLAGAGPVILVEGLPSVSAGDKILCQSHYPQELPKCLKMESK